VNSVNHGGQGQNVAFSDGHAEWARTPDVGAGGDNIWTLKVGGEHRVPKTGDLSVAHQLSGTVDDTDWDVVMVPTRDAKGGVH
jgi:prepilin-type processing-associated H-X9-DG protein